MAHYISPHQTHPLPDPPIRMQTRAAVGMGVWVRTGAHAFAECLFSTEKGPPAEEQLSWLLDEFEDFLGRATPRARTAMMLCIFVVSFVAPLVRGKFASLAALPISDRQRVLLAAEKGLFGPAVLAPKAVLSLLWFEREDVRREARVRLPCLPGGS